MKPSLYPRDVPALSIYSMPSDLSCLLLSASEDSPALCHLIYKDFIDLRASRTSSSSIKAVLLQAGEDETSACEKKGWIPSSNSIGDLQLHRGGGRVGIYFSIILSLTSD